MFFGGGPQDSSFVFNITEGTPSPRAKRPEPATLPRKYKPRDSGVVMSDDDDDMSYGGNHLSVVPPASTSVSSIQSDVDNLITPGFGPESSSGWPSVFVTGADDIGSGERLDVDAFIMRTLAAAASKGAQEMKKRVPGTPVKKMKTQFLARPWQSAVASKVGLRFERDTKGKAPRQSLPAAFPGFGKKSGKLALDQDSDSGEEEDSPGRRREKYVGLGLGRPSAPAPHDDLKSRTRWLMRRSSSGAFSSGSDTMSSSGTPTRMKGKGYFFLFCLTQLVYLFLYPDWHLGTPRLPVQFPSTTNKLSPIRSTSGSSNSSTATLNSPSIPSSRRLLTGSTLRPRRLSEPFCEGQPGRFEQDFVVDDEVGSGEFGKVIKVHYKNGDDHEVFAVKKSKQFEGPRHRWVYIA